jgi:membrane-bound lytic murein transglycosylase D
MVKIKSSVAVGILSLFLFLILPQYSNAQIAMDKVFAGKSIINGYTQTTGNEAKRTAAVKEKPEAKAESRVNLLRAKNKDDQDDDEQDMMDKALDLLEVADNYWENGDVDNTLIVLDKAYALILDTNGDPAVARQKDDLRLLVSKRILAAYSARQTVARGKASEIPLIMNADVEKEIRSFQNYERDFFIASYHRSGMYRPIILRELKKAGIPEELSWLPLVESGFKIMALSRARALGLWQFIPSTGYKFGLSRDEWTDERMDVEKSTQAAIAYLKELHGMFGDWLTVLAAYNCGEGRVLRVISKQHINYFDRFWDLYKQLPNETARYVPRFLATLHIIKNPQKYGMNLGPAEGKPIAYEFIKINKIMKLQDVAAKIDVSEETLNLLNSELRHKITPDKEYELKIPANCVSKFNLVVGEIPESEKPGFAVAADRSHTVYAKHKIKRGETVASVAKRYKVSPSTIASCNNISSRKRLAAGQRIKVPVINVARVAKSKQDLKSSKKSSTLAEVKQVYKVKKKDTLAKIAERFDVPVSKLKKLNKLKGNTVQAGQVLKISRADTGDPAEEKRDSGKKKG